MNNLSYYLTQSRQLLKFQKSFFKLLFSLPPFDNNSGKMNDRGNLSVDSLQMIWGDLKEQILSFLILVHVFGTGKISGQNTFP